MQGFKQYVDQYTKHNLDNDGEPYKVAFEQVNERWEIALTVSEKGFQQVSFVNSIATTKVHCFIGIFFTLLRKFQFKKIRQALVLNKDHTFSLIS